jgi:outer membrane protein assembly factor BamE (lipoprotein component of BamABCDE complex)
MISRHGAWLSVMLLFMGFVFSTAGCSTPAHLAFDTIQVGQSKSDVVEIMGSPQKTIRVKDQDQWVFVFFQGDEQIVKGVSFESGRVIAIEQFRSETPLERELKSVSSMREYEEKINSSRQKNENLRPIDLDSAEEEKAPKK